MEFYIRLGFGMIIFQLSCIIVLLAIIAGDVGSGGL